MNKCTRKVQAAVNTLKVIDRVMRPGVDAGPPSNEGLPLSGPLNHSFQNNREGRTAFTISRLLLEFPLLSMTLFRPHTTQRGRSCYPHCARRRPVTVQVGPGPTTGRPGPRASVLALPCSANFADQFTCLWGVLSSRHSAFQNTGFLKGSSRVCVEHQNQSGGASEPGKSTTMTS